MNETAVAPSPSAVSAFARPADPCSFVIFGASGDLTHRLLLPALYNLAAGRLLPDAVALIGVARKESSNEAFRRDLEQSLREFATRSLDERILKRLLANVTYVRGGADDAATYEGLGRALEHVEQQIPTRGNRLFYLATPPDAFAPIGCRLAQGDGDTEGAADAELALHPDAPAVQFHKPPG